MVLDQVNRSDVAVGHVKRRDIFARHAGFRVAHILIRNSEGHLLLQRLGLRRERNPGAWGSSVASYLFASETYEAAARRRVEQELGITVAALALVGKTEMVDDGCLKFISVFRMKSNGPFTINQSHIQEIEFVPVPQISRMVADGSRQFTPTFLHVFRFYLSALR